jgi:hypothetical protein
MKKVKGNSSPLFCYARREFLIPITGVFLGYAGTAITKPFSPIHEIRSMIYLITIMLMRKIEHLPFLQ